MANPWFRCYAEMVNDPKVQMLPEVMRWRWVAILCLRCDETLETLHDRHIAFRLRISESELAETKALFIDAGFIDEHWEIENWKRRQYVSDSSTERVRKFREKRKESASESINTQEGTDRNVTVTAPDTEQIQNQTQKQKRPSRAKKPREATKTDLAKSRHAEFKAAILAYWQAKNPGVEMPWGPAEGRNLEMWLRQSPQTTLEQFTGYLRHRFRSEVNHAQRPSAWIGNVTNFAGGAIDRFGKPLNGGSNGTSRSAQRTQRNAEAIRAGVAPGEYDGRITPELPSGVGGGFAQGPKSAGGDGLFGDPGRTIEG